jgi:hypothetical protein
MIPDGLGLFLPTKEVKYAGTQDSRLHPGQQGFDF